MFLLQQKISGSRGNCGGSPGCFVSSEVQFASVTVGTAAASVWEMQRPHTLVPLSGFCQLSHVLLRVNPIIVLLKGYTWGHALMSLFFFPKLNISHARHSAGIHPDRASLQADLTYNPTRRCCESAGLQNCWHVAEERSVYTIKFRIRQLFFTKFLSTSFFPPGAGSCTLH